MAAVAGLAALAVVLVTNVVSRTSEQISGNTARFVAARVAAADLESTADEDAAQQPANAKTWEPWKEHYTSKCRRMEIIYGDIGISVTPVFNIAQIGSKTDTVTAAKIVTSADGVSSEDLNHVTSGKQTTARSDFAVAVCEVSE